VLYYEENANKTIPCALKKAYWQIHVTIRTIGLVVKSNVAINSNLVGPRVRFPDGAHQVFLLRQPRISTANKLHDGAKGDDRLAISMTYLRDLTVGSATKPRSKE
jgi:hypothetical protein